MHYSIMTTAMTLRRLGCAFCMPFIFPFRSPFRPYNRAYAYRGLTCLRSAFHGGQRLFNDVVKLFNTTQLSRFFYFQSALF
ncbi:MAG: hypothetical protein KZQ60_06415 [Candidatus Thiodiazotropha sp. (ex Lucinoma aequizonata)]|nr:hypothetical protein [Candidatus Thiodiazotropha sp. (ex Lucinoma aequizonata)]